MSDSRKKKNDTEAVVAEAMREVNMAMREVAQATAPLKRLSKKNLTDYETDSLPYSEPVSAEPKIQTKGGSLQIKKPGILGSNTVINIQSAQNIQIGNNNTMIINSKRRQKMREYSPPPESKPNVEKTKIKEVLESTRPVDDSELLMVASKFMGQSWRRTLRLIGLEDIEIQSKHQDFYTQGIREVTYQCLKYWKRKDPDEATLGALATALSRMFSEEEVCDKFTP